MVLPDLFALLEIDEKATTEEVRRAYFRLAKQLHPDRQVSDDPAATERFLAVQQAYEILIDPKQREDYERQRVVQKHAMPAAATVDKGDAKREDAADALPKKGGRRGPSIEEERDARLAFQKAENLVESGQHDRALRAMSAVVRTVPDNPDYISLLGYLMAHQGEKLHAARDYCRRSVEAEPFNPEFHARLGYVYTQAGLINTAQQCFDEALRLDPRQALALAHREGGGRGEGGGLLGSFKRLLGR